MTPAWLVRIDGGLDVRFADTAPPHVVSRLSDDDLLRWRKDRTLPAATAPRRSASQTVLQAWEAWGPDVLDIDGVLHWRTPTCTLTRRDTPGCTLRYGSAWVDVQSDGARFAVRVRVKEAVWAWRGLCCEQLAALQSLRSMPAVQGLVIVDAGQGVEVILDSIVLARAADRASALRAAWRYLHEEARDATLYVHGRTGRLERIE